MIILFICCVITTSLYAPLTTAIDQWCSDVSGPRTGPVPVLRPRLTKQFTPLRFKPDIKQMHPLSLFGGMRVAHFELSLQTKTSESYQVSCYLASAQDQKHGTFTIRIVIEHSPYGSRVRAYHHSGSLIRGPVATRTGETASHQQAMLPWRDHTSCYYSVVMQTIEQKPYLVVIQHSRATSLAPGSVYRPAIVHSMLQSYCTAAPQLGLSDRPHAYLDRIEHMHVLPIPFTSDVYQFPLSQPMYIAWSVQGADVGVHMRKSG